MGAAIAMEKDIWYRLDKDIVDACGYTITGKALQYLRRQPYLSNLDIIYARTFDGETVHGERGWFIDRTNPWTKQLTEYTGAELDEFRKRIDGTRRHNPQAWASMASGVTMGSDPECFVTTKDDELLPAFEFLKAETKNASTLVKDGTEPPPPPYWDGFQAEFKVIPFGCIAYGTDRIQHQLSELQRLANAHKAGAKLVGHPVMAIPASVMANAADEHAVLGCMPSQNVYNLQGEQVEDGRSLPWRFAGWHIHMTLDTKQRQHVERIVKFMDSIIGVTSVAVLAGLESPLRRRYYGLAGEYRTPKYGVEYRALSSAALWHPALVHLHFNFARAAMQLATQFGDFDWWQGSDDETVEIMNTLDVDAARDALKRNRDLIIGLLKYYYYLPNVGKNITVGKKVKAATDNSAVVFDNLFLKGAMQLINLDMETNWHLTDCMWINHSEAPGAQMWKFAQEIAA